MTVMKIRVSGYGNSMENIENIHIYSSIFEKQGSMVFYGSSTTDSDTLEAEIASITDFKVDKSIVTFYIYPHVNEKALDACTASFGEDAYRSLYQFLKTQYPDQDIFTINFGTMKAVKLSDFTRFSHNPKLSKELIMFEGRPKETASVYIMECSTSEKKEFLKVFSSSSRNVSKLSDVNRKQSTFGKYFTYILIQSALKHKFNEEAPSLAGISFPTTQLDINLLYPHTEKFEGLIPKFGTDSVIVSGDVIVEKEVKSLLPHNSDKHILTETEEKIIKDVLEKGYVCLSDFLTYGVKETLDLLPVEEVIDVMMDATQIAKELSCYGGYVYAIPLQNKTAELEEEFGSYVIICSDADMPNKNQHWKLL